MLTIETIRVATVLYAIGVAAWLVRSDRVARLLWTAACAFFVAHVWAAFQFHHHWSHAAAYRATEKQAGWGGGLYFNYVFLALWVADTAWWWRGIVRYRARPYWITITIQTFFAFMFFNAAVVFGRGFIRWFGIFATMVLLVQMIFLHGIYRQRGSRLA